MAKRMSNETLVEVDSFTLDNEIVEALIPDKLYKYYSINEYLYKVIESHSLWYSSPEDFNDPFDCKIKGVYGTTAEEVKSNLLSYTDSLQSLNEVEFNQVIEAFSSKPKVYGKMMNAVLHYFMDENIGVCCFSENKDHPLMWAHYSNSHKGVCLEFNSKARGLIHDSIIPVQYYNDYPAIDINTFEKDKQISFYMQIIAAKGDDWDYEYEWRSFLTTGGRKAYEFDKDLLTGVIFGLRVDKKEQRQVIDFIKQNGYKNVSFYKALMHNNKFRIIIRRLKA